MSDNLASANRVDWAARYASHPEVNLSGELLALSPLMLSSLMYIVLETELGLTDKRRIVCLHSADLLYGSVTGKCVFLPIDWDEDWQNVVKVHENGHTWETSFTELNQTRDIALLSLFARAEVWAEGHYPALAQEQK